MEKNSLSATIEYLFLILDRRKKGFFVILVMFSILINMEHYYSTLINRDCYDGMLSLVISSALDITFLSYIFYLVFKKEYK